MTQRFKTAFALFVALAVATAGLWIVSGAIRKERPLRRGAGSSSPEREAVAASADGPELGGRADPERARALLADHLSRSPVDWSAVQAVAATLEEPLPPEQRRRLLAELRFKDRAQVLSVLSVLRDPTFTPDLLALLDDPKLVAQARPAVLQALSSMPALDRDEVVRGLESRIQGDMSRQIPLVAAIAGRGGPEAARALVRYLQGAEDPRRVPTWALRRLDVESDPQAAEVLALAIRSPQPPEVLRALRKMTPTPEAPSPK